VTNVALVLAKLTTLSDHVDRMERRYPDLTPARCLLANVICGARLWRLLQPPTA
jgi:hypothetical protein